MTAKTNVYRRDFINTSIIKWLLCREMLREKTVRSLLFFLALIIWGIVLSPALAPAALIVSESFNYGGTSGSLDGDNGGIGFSGAWSFNTMSSYNPVGLSFSDLSVTGGSAIFSGMALNNVTRPLTSPMSGTVYGMHLFKVSALGGTGTASVMIGGEFDGDTVAAAVLESPVWPARQETGIRMTANATHVLTGSAPVLDTTYLFLYQFDANPLSQTLTGWVLDASQFDTFKAGGFSTVDLNAATIGTGAANVFSRATFSRTGALSSTDYLHLFQTQGAIVTFDEIRFSNTSLNEAVMAVPEPTTTGLILLGVGLLLWPVRAVWPTRTRRG